MALPEIKQADFAGNFFAARDQARQQQQGAQRNALSGELMRWQINQLAIQDDMRKRAATQEDQVRRARQTYSEVDAVINAPPGQASAVLRDLATRDPSIAEAAKRLSESGLDLSNDEQIRQSLYGIRAHVAGIAGISAPQKEHTAPEQFTMTPGSVRYERAPDGSVRKVAAVPVAPDKPPDESFSQFADAEGNVFMVGNRGSIRKTDLKGRVKSGGGVTIGPDGQLVATPDPTKATEGERTSANYADRMSAAEALLGQYRPSVTDYMAARAVMSSGPVVASTANSVLSPEGQGYYQAAADWVRAKLRKESGAVISPQEMEQEIKTYFPLPNDAKQTIEQKKRSREQALSGMRKMAGKANTSQPAPGPKSKRVKVDAEGNVIGD